MGWIDGHELSFRQDSNGHTQWMHIIVFGLTELWRAQEKKIERRRKKERIFNYWLWMENEWMNELMIFCGWNGIICQAQPAGSNFLSPALTFFFSLFFSSSTSLTSSQIFSLPFLNFLHLSKYLKKQTIHLLSFPLYIYPLTTDHYGLPDWRPWMLQLWVGSAFIMPARYAANQRSISLPALLFIPMSGSWCSCACALRSWLGCTWS